MRAACGTLAGALLVVAVLLVCLPPVAGSAAADAPRRLGSISEESWASAPVTGTNPVIVHVPLIFKSDAHVEGPYGVQLFFVTSPIINRVSEINAGWARVPFRWESIEPQNTTPDHYSWSPYLEQRLAELSARQVRVILQLEGNPEWAATYPGGPIDRVDIAELTQFMQAAVARYSRPPYNVHHWELYNEPDNGDILYADYTNGYFGHTPQAYVDILAAVYQPVKDVDPGAVILFGGLAFDNWEEERPGNPFVQEFVTDVLELGGGAYFDAMNFHYYPSFRPKWEPWGHDILGKREYLRLVMAQHGVDKPIVCTESGWYTEEAAGGSHEFQSRYVVQVYVRSLSVGMSPTIWFDMVDEDIVGDWQWGLVNADLTPKPGYYAYQTLTRQLGFARYVRELTDAETGSYAVEAYEFRARGDEHRVVVAWCEGEQTHDTAFYAPQVTVTDKFGSESIVYDGDDGRADGRVHVLISADPLYLHFPAGLASGDDPRAGSLAPDRPW